MNPGWYQLPTDPTKLVYWDGQNWVGGPIPNPSFISQPDTTKLDSEYDSSQGGTVYSTHPNIHPTIKRLIDLNQSHTSRTSGSKSSSYMQNIVLLVMGIIFMTFGFGAGSFTSGLAQQGEDDPNRVKGTATVVSMDYNSDRYCIPVVQQNSDSQPVAVETTVLVKPCPVNVGDTVDITYVEGYPDSVRLASTEYGEMSTFKLIPVIFGGVGLFLASAAVFGFIKTARKAKEQSS